jgi:hypothetical protein
MPLTLSKEQLDAQIELIKQTTGLNPISAGAIGEYLLKVVLFLEERAKLSEDFVTETNSSTFIQDSLAQVESLKTQASLAATDAEVKRAASEILRNLTEQYKNETLLIKQSADSNTVLARIFQDSVNLVTNLPNLGALTLNNTTDKGKYWKVSPGGAGTTLITGVSVTAKEGDEFTWNGTKWVWTANALIISNNSITAPKTTFIKNKIGKNLVNPNDADVAHGCTISITNGTPTANSSYNVTGFIKVIPGEKYTVTVKRAVGWYTGTKTWISTDSNSPGTSNYVLTAPENAEYVRVTGPIGQWGAGFQLEHGATATPFEAYTEYDFLDNVKADQFTTDATARMVASMQSYFIAQSSNLADGSVSRQKALFISAISSKNLVNPADPGVQSGMTLSANGIAFVNEANVTTGFIKVIPGEKYTVSHKRTICWYNSSKVFVSVDENNVGLPNITVTAPEGSFYLRCSLRLTNWAAFQVETGDAATTWTPFDPTIKYVLSGVDAKTFSPDGEAKIKEFAGQAIPEILNTNGVSQNRIAIAPKMFIPSGREIAVYAENLQKVPDNASCEVIITGGTLGDRSSKIKPTAVGSTIIGVARISDAKKVTVQEKEFSITVTNSELTTPKKIINVGSSTTWRSTFVNRLMASAAATGLQFLGIRESSSSSPTVLCEGRGGWALSTYSALSKTLYSPFVQPAGVYMYLGNTDFWIKANAGMSSAVGQGYDYNNFVVANHFNPTTGYPLVPVLNTVVYDNIQSKFFRYSGTAWVEITEATLAFSFNFGKYRQTWGIAQPDIFHLLLGSNDFNSSNEATFSASYATFKTRLDILIASVKADSPNCIIVLALTYSSGKQGNNGNLTTERRKLALWLYTEKMITDYGGRESENIILLDYHSAVDRTYGFDGSDIKPFDSYTGAIRERVISDTTHLGSDGFNQMGDLYYGAIQHLR